MTNLSTRIKEVEERFDERFSEEWWFGFGTNKDMNKQGIDGIKKFISQELRNLWRLFRKKGMKE